MPLYVTGKVLFTLLTIFLYPLYLRRRLLIRRSFHTLPLHPFAFLLCVTSSLYTHELYVNASPKLYDNRILHVIT
jgi:hypothetical protein